MFWAYAQENEEQRGFAQNQTIVVVLLPGRQSLRTYKRVEEKILKAQCLHKQWLSHFIECKAEKSPDN